MHVHKLLLLTACFETAVARKTLLISADGFRWDYYGRTQTPGLDRLKQKGVHVKNLENAFVTDTFPNHFTLATGLYEESHGIIDNEMYDPVFDEYFNMSTTDSRWWQGGEPIWVTASKAGIKSACVNWVGCAIPIQGIHPTYWAPYDGDITYNKRVDTIVENIIHGDAELGLLYFEEPDHSCHKFGPNSEEVLDAIRRVDQAVMYLLEKIGNNDVNIIFTSDHGGYQYDNNQVILLDQYTQYDIVVPDGGAVANVWPKNENDTERILNDLSKIDSDKVICQQKQFLHSNLNYRSHRRIAPLVCVAELGWSIVSNEDDKKRRSFLRGTHGYDPTDVNSPMRPILLASGPDILPQPANEAPLQPFHSVNIYPLVFELLNIPQSFMPPINGTIANIHFVLKHSYRKHDDDVTIMQW